MTKFGLKTREPGGGGYPPIKVTAVLVVPFRGLNLWIGSA